MNFNGTRMTKAPYFYVLLPSLHPWTSAFLWDWGFPPGHPAQSETRTWCCRRRYWPHGLYGPSSEAQWWSRTVETQIENQPNFKNIETTTQVLWSHILNTSATFSGPPSSSMSSSRVLGGRYSARRSRPSNRSFFIFWASSTASWLVWQLSWLSALTYEHKSRRSVTLIGLNQDIITLLCHAATCSPVAGALGGLTEAVKAGLEEPSPEANKALWIESGSTLLLLFFFFFSFPFFGSFLISQGSKRRRTKGYHVHWISFLKCLLSTFAASCWAHRLPHRHQTRLWMGWNRHLHLLSWRIWSCHRCLYQILRPTPQTRSPLNSYPTDRRACEASSSAAFWPLNLERIPENYREATESTIS